MSFISVGNWIIATETIVCPPIYWVPDLVGLDYEECQKAYDGIFEFVIEEQYSYEYPEGVIIRQDPVPPGMVYYVGTEMRCWVSKGVRMVDVADVVGLDFDDAKKILEENTFTVTVDFVSEYSDDVPNGKVIATDPPAFEKAVAGSTVKVTVSGGKEPDVTDDETAP